MRKAFFGHPIKGKYKKGMYESPNQVYSMPMPESIVVGMGEKITDKRDGDTGVVSFMDALGNLVRVTHIQLDPTGSMPVEYRGRQAREALLQSQANLMDNLAELGVEATSPTLEHLTFRGNQALYFEFLGKGASHIVTTNWIGPSERPAGCPNVERLLH